MRILTLALLAGAVSGLCIPSITQKTKAVLRRVSSHEGVTLPTRSALVGREASATICFGSSSDGGSAEDLNEEAARLLARAKEIRESIPEKTAPSTDGEISTTASASRDSDGADTALGPSVGYRLYVDIGREDGTWMEPRWGASGRRIEFTIDVNFLTAGGEGGEDPSIADEEVTKLMVKDNFGGRSSPVRVVTSSENARLRGGFDKMACHGGGYRIDVGGRGNGGASSAVVRFHLNVDGTPETGSTYGDISVPRGCLHFSIPCFGGGVSNLSSRESPVTVRQIGWHTGFRREESRIVGTFRAVAIEDARKRDKY